MSSRFVPVFPAAVTAPVLKLDDPISIWGGVDQYSGRILDRTHPQAGENVAGRVLLAPMIRGSGGTPGSLATLIKRGQAPAGIVLERACMNVLTALVVANKLYGTRCPLFLSNAAQVAGIRNGDLRILPDGSFVQM